VRPQAEHHAVAQIGCAPCGLGIGGREGFRLPLIAERADLALFSRTGHGLKDEIRVLLVHARLPRPGARVIRSTAVLAPVLLRTEHDQCDVERRVARSWATSGVSSEGPIRTAHDSAAIHDPDTHKLIIYHVVMPCRLSAQVAHAARAQLP
jgi:hypothetical protein